MTEKEKKRIVLYRKTVVTVYASAVPLYKLLNKVERALEKSPDEELEKTLIKPFRLLLNKIVFLADSLNAMQALIRTLDELPRGTLLKAMSGPCVDWSKFFKKS